MTRLPAGALGVGAIVAALTFTGCAVDENAGGSPPSSPHPSETHPSAVPATSSSPEPSVPGVVEAQGAACAGLRSISNSAPADGVERILGHGLPGDAGYISGYALPEMRDTGATAFAGGQAIMHDDGTPAAYVVAAGDTLYGISERFCLQYPAYLEWINSVRRNGGWDWTNQDDGPFEIYPGDTVNLDAHTITSVGDEQGVVYRHEPNFSIPPQR